MEIKEARFFMDTEKFKGHNKLLDFSGVPQTKVQILKAPKLMGANFDEIRYWFSSLLVLAFLVQACMWKKESIFAVLDKNYQISSR